LSRRFPPLSSYKPAIFAKAARILRKRAILPERSVARFEALTRELSHLSETLLALDDILGDIPDAYADGLMGTLMQDPVQLPQSRQFVDRSTIHRQLMNKTVDPFSNTPLTADMLIEQPQLKEEIARWIEERKAAWREAKQKEEADAAAAVDAEEDASTQASSSNATSSTTATSSSIPAPAQARKSYLDD
jgi:ubiquitin conjugation factor E4 B